MADLPPDEDATFSQQPGEKAKSKFALDQENARKTILESTKALELSGEIYPWKVEIVFPPPCKAKFGLDGLIVDVCSILNWMASDLQAKEPVCSERLRAIAEEFYKDDNDFDDVEIDLEGLDLLISEMEAGWRGAV
jgi:hypothetical protein